MDGIIFDVDGTLWDSVEVVAESWNLAIKENSDLEPNLNREILQGLRRRYGHTQGAGSGISSFYCKQLPVRIY